MDFPQVLVLFSSLFDDFIEFPYRMIFPAFSSFSQTKNIEFGSVLYICTAMPCAATPAMQSEMYHCDNSLASRGVALSTAFSILTLPLMLLLA